MNTNLKLISAAKVARAYLVIVLVLSVLVSSYLQLGLALALLIIQLYSTYKPPRASLNLVLVVGSLIFAPLALEGLAGVYAVLLMVPALFLLDESLKNFALTQTSSFSHAGRSASDGFENSGGWFVFGFWGFDYFVEFNFNVDSFCFAILSCSVGGFCFPTGA